MLPRILARARVAPRFALALALGGPLGCGALGDPPPSITGGTADDAETASPLEGEPDARTEAEKLEAKLALHVECLERSADHIEASWARYAERVGEDGRPKSKKVTPYLYEIDGELEPCERASAEAAELEPARPDLDRLQRAYLDASSTFAALTVDLHAYYERQGFSEDDWATSIELAPKIRQARAAWVEAHEAFAELLAAERHDNDAAMLEVIREREGKTLRYFALELRIAAEAFAACAEAGEREACRDQATALAETHRAFETAHDGDPDSGRVFWMSSYRASAAELATTAATFVASAKKGKPAVDVDDVQLAWSRMDRDWAHLDFDFPR